MHAPTSQTRAIAEPPMIEHPMIEHALVEHALVEHAMIEHAMIEPAIVASGHLAAAHGSPFARLCGRRILVLDDDPLAGVIASLDLEDAGAPFVLVHDEGAAHAALDRAQASGAPFDAAVLDVNLGGGRTSRSVARRLRDTGIPFVLHTAEPRTAPAQWDVAEWGAGEWDVPVIGKPVPAGAIALALARLVSAND